jgi:CRISPR-associated endonuclease Csn1
MDQSKKLLSLDLGISSVGWALLEIDSKDEVKGILDLGSRIFSSPSVPETKVLLNKKRTSARQMRRRLQRKARRLAALKKYLLATGLLPSDESVLKSLYETNPYELRSRGLKEKLSAFELGRVIYQLSHRRGYKSNQRHRESESEIGGKSGAIGNDDSENGMLAGINQLEDKLREAGELTVGAYLASIDPRETRYRSRFISRQMVAEEIALLFERQRALGNPKAALYIQERVQKIALYQRDLKLQKHLVGRCTYEPTRKRAPKWSLIAQRFAVEEALSNLKLECSNGLSLPICSDLRALLRTHLSQTKVLKWKKVKSLAEPFLIPSFACFNLQRSFPKGLPGARTETTMREVLPKTWDTLCWRDKETLLADLNGIAKESSLKKRLLKKWHMLFEGGTENEVYEKLLKTCKALSPGYCNLSEKAMRRMVPYLEQGDSVHQAKERCAYQELVGIRTELLRPLCQIENHGILNPVVIRAYSEARKIINAVIKKHGKLGTIRIELARDLPLSPAKRNKLDSDNRKREQENELIRQKIKELTGSQKVSTNDIRKYKLWNESKHRCVYTGRPISLNDLFGGEPLFEVEHIIPLSRSADSGLMNLTLSDREFNRLKGNRTPFEMYADDPEEYERLLARIKSIEKFPNSKYERFRQREINNDFVASNLTDTRYIAREVKKRVAEVVDDVHTSSGRLTSILRGALLGDMLGHKSRLDHRHHAVDALIIGCLTPKAIHHLIHDWKRGLGDGFRFQVSEPFRGFKERVKELYDSVIVSHRPERGIRGALHDEKLYGTAAIDGEIVCVIRKKLEDVIKNKKVEDIIDRKLLEHVAAHLEAPMGTGTIMWNGRPLRHVRVKMDKVAGVPIRGGKAFVAPQNNLYLEIFEIKGGLDHRCEVTRCLDAKRVKKETSFSQSDKCILRLYKGDTIELCENGKRRYVRVVQFSIAKTGAFEVGLRCLRSADTTKDSLERITSLKRFMKWSPRRVDVSPLGVIEVSNELPDFSNNNNGNSSSPF